MPFRSEKQRRYLWKNNPEIARKWTNEHGSTPVKAKKGKYQELEHPDHEIKPIEHKEENVSSKERVEKLLDERKTKKETKKKLVKQGQNYVPGWRPNLSVKAKDSKYITRKTALKGHADSIKEIYKVANENKKGDRLTKEDVDNARKDYYTSREKNLVPSKKKSVSQKLYNTKQATRDAIDYLRKQKKESKETNIRTRHPVLPPEHFRRKIKTGGPIKAKKGLWTGAKTNIFEAPSGWDAKKISKKTGEKLFKVFKHRERGGYKQATDYKKYLKGLKKITGKTHSLQGGTKLRSLPANLSAATKVAIAQSPFLKRRFKLAGNLAMAMDKGSASKKVLAKMSKTLGTFPAVKSKSLYFKDAPKASKLSTVLKKVGRRTGIGKAVAAATVVAGAYEAGKRKLFTKEGWKKGKKEFGVDKETLLKKKKKVTKKSIGGETVVMKSGGGYIDDLL